MSETEHERGDAKIGRLERKLDYLRHENDVLILANQELRTALQQVREALKRIADHDNDRWQSDADGEMERQATPQEIAQTAIASLAATLTEQT